MLCCTLNPNKKQIRDKVKETSSRNYNARNPLEKHILKCPVCGNDFVEMIRKKQFENGDYRKTCSESCAHNRKFSEETRHRISESLRGKSIGGGHRIVDSSTITCVCEECGNNFQAYKTITAHKRFSKQGQMFSHRFCSNECLNEYKTSICSKVAKERCAKGEFGGKNNETYKKHKHGWYHGLYCGSSWELAFVLWKEHNGFTVKRSELVLPYEYNGKTYHYYPDYEVDGVVYEVKGFEDYKAKIKHKTYPWIEYYNRDRMKPIIEEVRKLFGKDFIKLLEDHK